MLTEMIKLCKINSFKKISFFVVIFAVLFFNFATNFVYAQYSNIYYTKNQLSITTTNATNITNSSANLNSSGLNIDHSYATTWFEYGPYYNLGSSTPRNSYGFGYFTHSYNISALNPNTNYYFRAIAQGPQGIVYGIITPFRTNQNINNNTNQTIFLELRVNTNLATNVSSTKAQLNGLITNQGTISSNTYFEWGTNYNLINKTQIILTGSFPIVRHINKLTRLTPNTTYYFRIIADNGFSRSVGVTTYFTTSPATVKTDNTKTKEPTNTATVTPINSDKQIENNLSASIINANFLPGNLFDWLLLIIFILTLILLTQYMFPPVVSKQEDNEQY